MNLRMIGHIAYVGLLAVHAVSFFFLPVAASIGQSKLAFHMLVILLASASTSIGSYALKRPLVGLLIATLGVSAAGAMWGVEIWKRRPRPADRVEATFPGFKIVVPAGQACYLSYGGQGSALLTLRPASGECPAFFEGAMIEIWTSRQPGQVVGDFSLLVAPQQATSILPQQVPAGNSEEDRAISNVLHGGEIIVPAGRFPSAIYSCQWKRCHGAARYKSTLVKMTWPEEPDRPAAQTMLKMVQQLDRWVH